MVMVYRYGGLFKTIALFFKFLINILKENAYDNHFFLLDFPVIQLYIALCICVVSSW